MTTIQFADSTKFRRASSTRNSSDDSQSAVLDDRDHKQDWTKTTEEKDTWASRERRRSSVWNGLDMPRSPAHNKDGSMSSQRHGSILSIWSPTKDKNGRDILGHDGSTGPDDDVRSVVSAKSGASDVGSPKLGPYMQPAREDRRGSILSMWKGGKDANGKDTLAHDDEEWAR